MGETTCVCIYWFMNQYGFSYTKRPPVIGSRYLSLPSGPGHTGKVAADSPPPVGGGCTVGGRGGVGMLDGVG